MIAVPEEYSPRLCIDETAMSNGELYTIISNPDAHGGKGTLVAIVEGVKSDNIIDVLKRIPERHRSLVKEVTLDMSGSINRIVTRCFPSAIKMIDRAFMYRRRRVRMYRNCVSGTDETRYKKRRTYARMQNGVKWNTVRLFSQMGIPKNCCLHDV